MDIQEGPVDGSLLTFQQSHRSHSIWENDGEPPLDSKTIKARRSQSKLKKLDPPAPQVLRLIRQAGFGGVVDLPFISLDSGLMTALIERWRPETHTFHLRTGEWTVTLQDVEVLLGLPVDGEPIIGSTNEDWEGLCHRLLGIVPQSKVDRIGGKVTMRWLREHFRGHLPAGYTEEHVHQQARGYILQLLGGVLLSDHSGSQVHLAYLTLLEDLTIVRSWGSACLANLYHYLCHGCKTGNDNVGGAFILLQLWAWERFPFVAPGRLGTRQRPAGSPLHARWDDNFHSPDLATHVVGYYRHYFDIQRADEVIWRPYSEELIASLPPICSAGREIWMAKVPLLHFAMVQMHMPDRVMRQFGYRQTIPPHCNCRQPPHGKNWKSGQKGYLEKWLRKKPPMYANPLEAEAVFEEEQVDPFIAQDPVYPFVHIDPIPDTGDAGTSYAPQYEEGGSVSSSFTQHLGSVQSYPLTPMFLHTSPHPMHTPMADPSPDWFDYPLQPVGGMETTFVGTSGQHTGEGEGDGVVTQDQFGEQDVQVDQEGTPSFVPRRSHRQPHPAACGTGSHKQMYYSRRRKDM